MTVKIAKIIDLDITVATVTANCNVDSDDPCANRPDEDWCIDEVVIEPPDRQHICESVNHLTENFSRFDNVDYLCRQRLIDSISNTMSDRGATNYAAICLINDSWNKELNELSFASSELCSQFSQEFTESC